MAQHEVMLSLSLQAVHTERPEDGQIAGAEGGQVSGSPAAGGGEAAVAAQAVAEFVPGGEEGWETGDDVQSWEGENWEAGNIVLS